MHKPYYTYKAEDFLIDDYFVDMIFDPTPESGRFWQKFIDENKIVIVDCWAPWCGPCRRMIPVMEELSAEIGDKVGVAKLDVDNNQAVSIRFGIRVIPTVLIFKDKVLVDTLVGLRSKQEFIDYIKDL